MNLLEKLKIEVEEVLTKAEEEIQEKINQDNTYKYWYEWHQATRAYALKKYILDDIMVKEYAKMLIFETAKAFDLEYDFDVNYIHWSLDCFIRMDLVDNDKHFISREANFDLVSELIKIYKKY